MFVIPWANVWERGTGGRAIEFADAGYKVRENLDSYDTVMKTCIALNRKAISNMTPLVKNTLLTKRVMCVNSNSRNDVPRVAQRYGAIAAYTRRRASVL